MPTYYVNAASAASGDGSTNALSSGDSTHAFDSIGAAQTAVLAIESDLSVSGKVTFLCEGTGDIGSLVLDGFTNASATNYVEILGNADGLVTGVPGGGVRMNSTSVHTLEIRVPYTRIGDAAGNKGIEIDNNGGTGDLGLYINGTANSVDMTDIYICGCIIWTDDSSSSRDGVRITATGQGAGASVVNMRNCAIWGWRGHGIHQGGGTSGDVHVLNVDHCTIFSNTGDGIELNADTGATSTCNLYNSILVDNATDISTTGLGTQNYAGSNNITLDTTYNEDGLTGGAQATSGYTDLTQSTGAWVVITENATGATTNAKLLDEEAGNLPVAYGTNRTSVVSVDAFGQSRATVPDAGFFEFAAAADTTAPTFSVAPAVTSITSSGGTAGATINETGDIYYVVVADAATAPTPTEVIAGTGSGGSGELAAGSALAGTVLSDAFSGLSASTAYDVYFVARDDEGSPNVQASVTKVDFTTAASATVSITSFSIANAIPGTAITVNLADGTGPYTFTYKGETVTADSQNATSATFNSWGYPWDRTTDDVAFDTNYDFVVTDTGDANNTDTASLQTTTVAGESVFALTYTTLPEASLAYDDAASLATGDEMWWYQSTGTGITLDVEGVPSGQSDGDVVKFRYRDLTDGLWGTEKTTTFNLANNVATGVPVITGTAQEGQTLTYGIGSLADADGIASIALQWYADAVVISGATSSTYVLTQDEVGAQITVGATITDSLANVESEILSAATSAVVNVNDTPTGQPAITGTATQGQTLTYGIGTLADQDGIASVAKQWYRDAVAISGATGTTYVLTQTDVGAVITVGATITDNFSNVHSEILSAATSSVANIDDAPTGSVTIDNTAPVDGDTLTMSDTIADADGLGTFSYSWLADDVAIDGETSTALVVTSALIGAVLKGQIDYTDGFGNPETVTSAGTTAVDGLAPSWSQPTININVVEGTNTINTAAALGSPTLTYADGGTDAALITTNASTGVMTLASGVFTAATKASYSYTRTASSAHGSDAVQTITLTVVDQADVSNIFTGKFNSNFSSRFLL